MDTKTSSYLTDRLNQITHITTIADGVTKERSFTYDADGNTAQVADDDSTSQYSYDDADRLSSIVHKNDQGVNLSKNTYVYDGYDRLRIITRYTWNVQASAWSQQSQKKFVYDGMQVIQERDGDDNVVATDIWDGNISGLEAWIVYDVDTPTNPPQKYFYHYDGSGNVTAVTDETQQTVAQYEYDAYGNVTSSSGVYASQNPWRFNTKYYDSGSELYYYGYRFYSPGLGRWINRDPIAENGGLNLYGFVWNNPNDYIDPYGLDASGAVMRSAMLAPSFAGLGAMAAIAGDAAVATGAALGGAAVGVPVAVGAGGAALAYGAYRYAGQPLARWLYPDEMELPAPPGAMSYPGTLSCPLVYNGVPDDAIPETYVPESLKRSRSWAGELARMTYKDLGTISNNPKDPRRNKAGKMRKLMKEAERILKKIKNKGRR